MYTFKTTLAKAIEKSDIVKLYGDDHDWHVMMNTSSQIEIGFLVFAKKGQDSLKQSFYLDFSQEIDIDSEGVGTATDINGKDINLKFVKLVETPIAHIDVNKDA